MIIPYCNNHGRMEAVGYTRENDFIVFECNKCNDQFISDIKSKDYLSIGEAYIEYQKELIKTVDEAIKLLSKYEDINLKSIAFGLKMAIERIKE